MTRIERVRAYEKEILKIYKKIRRLQDNCKHKRWEGKKWGNTGNWDPNDDCYGIDKTCLDCDKRWTEPQ